MQKQEYLFGPLEQRVHYREPENNEPISLSNNVIEVVKSTQESLYVHTPYPCGFIKRSFSCAGQF